MAKLRVLAGRENGWRCRLPSLSRMRRRRAALLDALCIGTTTTRDLALAVLADSREPSTARAAAARTLGCASVGEPEVVAALMSALEDADAGVVAGAARGLALSVPSRARLLLVGLVGDTRPTGEGDSVGNFVASELDAMGRRCR